VANVPDGQLRSALDQLTAEQSPAALVLAEMLVQRWSEKSPAEAAQWITGLPDDEFGHRVFQKVARAWAVTGFAAAVDWIQQLPAGGNRAAAIDSLAAEAAGQNEAITAIKLITGDSLRPERDDLLSYEAQQWATTDRDGAVTWVNTIEDPALRETILSKIALNLGAADPLAAAKFIATVVPVGKERDDAVIDIVRFWACATPTDTAAWVEQFPEGQLRVQAMEGLIDVWGREDSLAAGAWLAQLPAGSSRDAAAKIYAAILSPVISNGSN